MDCAECLPWHFTSKRGRLCTGHGLPKTFERCRDSMGTFLSLNSNSVTRVHCACWPRSSCWWFSTVVPSPWSTGDTTNGRKWAIWQEAFIRWLMLDSNTRWRSYKILQGPFGQRFAKPTKLCWLEGSLPLLGGQGISHIEAPISGRAWTPLRAWILHCPAKVHFPHTTFVLPARCSF